MSLPELPSSTETGKLQVMHLKRYWNKSILKRAGKLPANALPDEWKMDTTLLTVLGLGLEQTIVYVYRENPGFEEFENWILATSGAPDAEKIEQFNQLFTDGDQGGAVTSVQKEVLSKDDLEFWEQNGYVIIRAAISREAADDTIKAICDHIGIDRYDSTTWYNEHPSKQGIMVQLFQHPAMEQNRRSGKIKKAYEELWNRTDLWVSADRVGFNPPETEFHKFQGPRLHWDVSLKQPIPFGLQGILYLSDTAEDQGALTLVPGFQNRIEAWLNNLPPGTHPRQQDLYALGAKPVAANAGDFIIWHQALPHGSSPNTSALPRFVQYINYTPADEKESGEWI